MPSDFFDLPQNNAQRAELWEDFDTARLARASDALSHMLSVLGCNIPFGSNELSNDLERLHKLIDDQQESAEYPDIDPDVFDLADSIDSRMYDIKEATEIVINAVSDLAYLFPDPDEDYEEE